MGGKTASRQDVTNVTIAFVSEITIRAEVCGQESPELIVKRGEKRNISYWAPFTHPIVVPTQLPINADSAPTTTGKQEPEEPPTTINTLSSSIAAESQVDSVHQNEISHDETEEELFTNTEHLLKTTTSIPEDVTEKKHSHPQGTGSSEDNLKELITTTRSLEESAITTTIKTDSSEAPTESPDAKVENPVSLEEIDEPTKLQVHHESTASFEILSEKEKPDLKTTTTTAIVEEVTASAIVQTTDAPKVSDIVNDDNLDLQEETISDLQNQNDAAETGKTEKPEPSLPENFGQNGEISSNTEASKKTSSVTEAEEFTDASKVEGTEKPKLSPDVPNDAKSNPQEDKIISDSETSKDVPLATLEDVTSASEVGNTEKPKPSLVGNSDELLSEKDKIVSNSPSIFEETTVASKVERTEKPAESSLVLNDDDNLELQDILFPSTASKDEKVTISPDAAENTEKPEKVLIVNDGNSETQDKIFSSTDTVQETSSLSSAKSEEFTTLANSDITEKPEQSLLAVNDENMEPEADEIVSNTENPETSSENFQKIEEKITAASPNYDGLQNDEPATTSAVVVQRKQPSLEEEEIFTNKLPTKPFSSDPEKHRQAVNDESVNSRNDESTTIITTEETAAEENGTMTTESESTTTEGTQFAENNPPSPSFRNSNVKPSDDASEKDVAFDSPKEEHVIAAIYDLLGATSAGNQEKGALRKRKATAADFATDDGDTSVPKSSNYRAVDAVFPVVQAETSPENDVTAREAAENGKTQQQRNPGHSLWSVFLNAYNAASGIWDTSKADESQLKVIPAPQLGQAQSHQHDDDAILHHDGTHHRHHNKVIKTEEIQDGGITHVIVGSFDASESQFPMSGHDHLLHEGQSLSVSYQLSVEPHHGPGGKRGTVLSEPLDPTTAHHGTPVQGKEGSQLDRGSMMESSHFAEKSDTSFQQPKITYDWIPSNGPEKRTEDNHENYNPKENVPTVAVSSHATLKLPRKPIIQEDFEEKLYLTKERTAEEKDTGAFFLPGAFVKAKFRPDTLEETVADIVSDSQAILLENPNKKVDVIPDEKVKIPLLVNPVIQEEKDIMGVMPADPATEKDPAETEMKSVNTADSSATTATTAPGPADNNEPVIFEAAISVPKFSQKLKPLNAPSKVTPYPMLKKKDGILVLGFESSSSSPIISTTSKATTVKIEDLFRNVQNPQVPSVVIISGKSKTRQQRRLAVDENNELLMRDPVEALRRGHEKFFRFLETQPTDFVDAFLDGRINSRRKRDAGHPGFGKGISCDWSIKAEDPSLFLLVTFRNISAPFSIDCQGAYIEVERENNGFQARWCDTKMPDPNGARQNIILARSEVRLGIFDDEASGKNMPTGFDAEVEVIDIRDSRNYEKFRNSMAYGQLRRLTNGR
ncbi:unnamed protein product [Notodromas monacha]|uniref:CUB domain-containing protein n=1 Tax=Notodromas monacha TaxID=399045 RepID=A0A7R9BDI5_9CRUS|nr:unnamed protein product [Notodromas monacha]CAG0913390.1 unnamed protein product [Notodromas monacha]